MSKRKSQDEDEVFDDNAPVPSSSNNGKHSRKSCDVVDNGRGSEIIVQSDPSKPVRAKSAHPISGHLDEGRKGKLDRTAGMIRGLPFRADEVDATPTPPQYVAYEYKEDDNFDNNPHAIEVRTSVAEDAEGYDMGHPKRGTCLVFNHQTFEREPSRDGSDVDVKRIEGTFGRLGFDVVVHDNLAYVDVMDKIKTLSEIDNHTNNDCVCVFVLTHGYDNDLLSAKDAAYRSDKIWKPFTADNCPTLAGKPKLFFFQACRGNKPDGSVRMKIPLDIDIRDQTDNATTASYTIPTLSDFLIAHSCADGFYSWRNIDKGTWFVQSLCDVIDKYAESTDLLKMLTMTARRVATKFQSFDDKNPELHAKKQIPSTTSTLTRDLYFMPK